MDLTVIARLCAVRGRGACTDAERRAAQALHDELRAEGEEAWVEARWVRPQRRASLLLHALLVVAGGLASTSFATIGAAVAGGAALSLVLEAFDRRPPLALLFVRRATQHVITVPEAERVVTLLIVAGYDAPRSASRPVRAAARRLDRLPGRPMTWAAGFAALVALAALGRALGLEGAWLGVVQLVGTLALLGAVAGAVDTMGSPWSPGAGNAGAVAVALSLVEELRRDPPRALAPALLLAGARTAGGESLRGHLRREKARSRDTVLLEIGPVGAGPPGWTARHSQLRAAAGRAAATLAPPEGRRPRVRPPAGRRRLPAVTIAGAPPDGDEPGAVDAAALEAALDLALGVVDALDADLAQRHAPAAAAT